MEKNYVVYQHVTPDGMYYFGQTQNVERRWRNNGVEYKGTALQPYIEKFGWDNIQHIVLFKDQTRENALWIEDFLITTAQEDGVCINKQRSGLVSKEEGYNQRQYQKNRDEILEQKQDYYQKNKDELLEQQREYYEKNKQQIRKQQKQYYEQNKEQLLEQKKQYREKNREKLIEQKQDYYQKNKDKIREYQRQYYKRKKLEKQLKEIETTPLF